MNEPVDESRVNRLMDLYERALEIPTAVRDAFLDRECGSDEGFRRELDSLLEAHASADAYFDALVDQLVSASFAPECERHTTQGRQGCDRPLRPR